jgi:hypothetical protein
MKMNKLSVPVSLTTALAFVIACGLSCAKKNTPVEKPLAAPPEPLPTQAGIGSTNPATATNATDAAHPITVTNIPATAATTPADITNLPPAETTTKADETPAPTMAATNVTIVEMPATTPAAPTNFYSADFTNASCCTADHCTLPDKGPGSTNFFFRFRAGYSHINHGDNNDSYTLGVKFYAYGDGLRERAGKNGWLIPDADAEISSQFIAKPDNHPSPGSAEGTRFRADFTWPWLHWTTRMFARTNSDCLFSQPFTFTFGPTVNVGFHRLDSESDYRFARYAGVRLNFNRDGFIEYTGGETDGLAGSRQQIVTELPLYQSRDGEVRYYLRGLWNSTSHNQPDILEGGLFVEMPFHTLTRPCKWGDLVPFLK